MYLKENSAFLSGMQVRILNNVTLERNSEWTSSDNISLINATIDSGQNSTLRFCMLHCQKGSIRGSGRLITGCPEPSRSAAVVNAGLNWAGQFISSDGISFFRDCVIYLQALNDTLGDIFIGQFAIQRSSVSTGGNLTLFGSTIFEETIVSFRSGFGNLKVNGNLLLADNCTIQAGLLTIQALSSDSSLELRQMIL
jgi:hypothetical protein